jgi:LacI family transcriptional regulator
VRQRRSIALNLSSGVPHLERMLHGIIDYAHNRAGWSFVMNPERGSDSMADVANWGGDGVIALIDSHHQETIALDLGVPVVNLSGVLPRSAVPRVRVDYHALGRLAAEHLLNCGLVNFAYYGLQQVWYAEARGEGFREHLQQYNRTCETWEGVSAHAGESSSWHKDWEEVDSWLITLPKPVGIFTCSDGRARLLMESCHRRNIGIPDDMAIIGTNNDDLMCEFCDPPLSSISRNDYQVGWESAALLDRLIDGESPPEEDVVLPPGKVIKRGSSDVLIVDNPDLKKAIQFIEDNFSQPITVDDVVRHLSISRRTVEYLFAEHLGRTPYDFISEIRISRAKQLLGGKDVLSVLQVARACGMENTRRFKKTFEKLVGMTPNQFRETEGANVLHGRAAQ